ncbi:MAG: hypothetical protein ACM3JP_03000 [Betaproteobacteria bacterium]
MSVAAGPLTALQRQASAALGDIRQAVSELGAILRPGQIADDELLLPVRRLAHGLAGVAQLAVSPMVQLVDIQRKFIESQRDLADQMSAWADLQHQLADRVAAWADLQRQVANALEKSLGPVSGAANLTTQLLQEVVGSPPAGTSQRQAKATAPRARPAKKARSR